MTSKYDDVEFHLGDAFARGRTEDDAFVHIGFILIWLIRNDLASHRFFDKKTVESVRSGTLTGTQMREFVDGKFMSTMVRREAARFLDAYYPVGYGQDYAAEFADEPDFEVPDDTAHESRIIRRLDAAWTRWRQAGSPGPLDDGALWGGQMGPMEDLEAAWRIVWRPSRESMNGSSNPVKLATPADSHVDFALEKVVSRVAPPGLRIKSDDARAWGNNSLNKTLRDLGVSQSSVTVLTAVGSAPGDPRVEVYRIPGIDAKELKDALVPYFGQRSRLWHEGSLGSLEIRRAIWKGAGLPDYAMVWYVLDGFAVHVVGQNVSAVDALALELAASLAVQ